MDNILLMFIIEFLSSTEAMDCPCLSKANIDFASIGGAAAEACILASMIILVVVCLLKRRKKKEYNEPSARRYGYSVYENCHPDEPSNVGEDAKRTQVNTDTDRNPDDMIILENHLYISADSVPHTSTTTSSNNTGPSGTQIPDDVIILENPMYVSADSATCEQSNNQRAKPSYQSTVHNGENPQKTFSRVQNLNPNDIDVVVNKKPKAMDKPSEPTMPTKPSKPIQPNIYAVVNKKSKAIDKPSEPTMPTKPSQPIKPNIYAIVNKKPKATDKPQKPPKPYPQSKPVIAVKPPVPKKLITKL